MRKLLVLAAVLTFCMSAPALADLSYLYSTYGYTALTYAVSPNNQQVAGHGLNWYRCVEFTLYNLSKNATPYLDASSPAIPYVTISDALWMDFNRNIAFGEAPNSEWGFEIASGNIKLERYAADPAQKLWAPPSVEPGGSLAGFKTYFDVGSIGASFTMPSFTGAAHLIPVVPTVDSGHPPVPAHQYTERGVYLNANDVCQVYDFWDGPSDDPNTDPNEVVPEASTVLLAALGMVAPVGYLRLRRRVK